jgi:phage-related protein
MTTYTITQTYGGYPVRGYLHVPDGGAAVRDAVVMFHPTIEKAGDTPATAAQFFLSLALTTTGLNIGDKILFSVAYPQDSIPGWTQTQANALFPGITLSSFYIGDNISYVSAALQWAITSLNSYLTSLGTGKSRNRIFTFGHSQGAYLAHRLNTMHAVDGVICNAPGPIDLLTRCQNSEANGDNNPTCSKLKTGYGSTSATPTTYSSRSLQAFLSGTLSPAFFIQALDDPTGKSAGVPQVAGMTGIIQPGLNACITCGSFIFGYYQTGGHPAFSTNPLVQADIRQFLTSLTITDRSTANQTKYTFGWTASYAPTRSVTPRVRKAQFSDGYSQRLSSGLNTQPSKWELTFAERDDQEKEEITTFLEFHGGTASFNWTPPHGSAGLYVCEKWQVTLKACNFNTINATFREVFEP